MPYRPADPTAGETAHKMGEEQALAAVHHAVSVAPRQPVPQSSDLFANLEDEEEEEGLGEAPAL
ncbi:MAG: hypothetical protein K2X55_12365 [Burkholderiaceae bacterium]|nr:hypothetical protein [Burkholderiaceae bacterium]